MEDNINYSKLSLIKMTCKTCGAPLQYSLGDKEVICMSCGNKYAVGTIKEKNNVSEKDDEQSKVSFNGGQIRIDGIKTSSSALAYIEQFLDSFDWNGFAYDSDCVIDELDSVVENLKVTSADDFKTWIAALTVLVIPYTKKIEFRKVVFNEIIEDYKKGNLDSFALFESYKATLVGLIGSFDRVKELANKYLSYAKKYGLPKDDEKQLIQLISKLNISEIEKEVSYKDIEEVPEIVEYNKKQEKELLKELKEKGIDPDEVLSNVNKLIEEKQYASALDLLYSIKYYKNADKLAEKINGFFTIQEAFINEGKYYFKNKQDNGYSLHEIRDGVICTEYIVNDLSKIIGNYADIIFYFNSNKKIVGLNLTNKKIVLKTKPTYDTDVFYQNNKEGKCYLVTKKLDTDLYSIHELNYKTNEVKVLIDNINKVKRIFNNYAICSQVGKNGKGKIVIYDLNTFECADITNKVLCEYTVSDKKFYYTTKNPNTNNKTLCVFNLETKESVVLDRNVVKEFKVINNHVYFYTQDNIKRNFLIVINNDGTNRRELGSYVTYVLFESGEWVYFIKSFKYNSALCKMKFDGNGFKIIAFQIRSFIKIEGGYIFYKDFENNLHKVRNDGTRNVTMCYNVDVVVKSTAEKVVYQAEDDTYRKSLYAIDFNQEGRRKASYDIVSSKQYDENTVYYIKHNTSISQNQNGAEQPTVSSRFLCKIDLNTYEETIIATLMTVEIPQKVSMKALSTVLSWIFGIIWCIILIVIGATNNAAPYEEGCYINRSNLKYQCVYKSSPIGWFLVIFFIILRIAILIIRSATLKNRKAKVPMGILTLAFASVLGGILTLFIPDSEYE